MKIGRMENRERKIGWKMLFSTVWLGKENRGEKILFQAHNFYPPKSRGKSKRKSAFTALLHKYSLPPTLIHDLMTFSPTPLDDFCPQTIIITFLSSHLTFTAHQRPVVQVLFSLSLSLSLSLNVTWCGKFYKFIYMMW